MTKLIIPTILTATILIAGMFAFMPVEKATTVHTTIQASTANVLTLTAAPTPATAASDLATWTINRPFTVLSMHATGSGDANIDSGLCDITTNLIATGDNVEVFNPNQATTAAGWNILLREAQTVAVDIPASDGTSVAQNPAAFNIDVRGDLVGTTTLAIDCASDAGDAGDVLTVTAVIETRGDITAPVAVLS